MELKIGDSVVLKLFNDLDSTIKEKYADDDKEEYNKTFAGKEMTICNILDSKIGTIYELKEDKNLSEYEQYILEIAMGIKFTKLHGFTTEFFEERIGDLEIC